MEGKLDYSDDLLKMVAAKTTRRDRRRQILNEADVADGKTGPTSAGLSERFSEPFSLARRMQDIESDMG